MACPPNYNDGKYHGLSLAYRLIDESRTLKEAKDKIHKEMQNKD